MHMAIEKPKKEHYIPLENPEILETRDQHTHLVETNFNDPEILELVQKNAVAIREGSININDISGLIARKEGFAYKVLRDDEQDKAVGAVYAVRKGMDTGSIQIAYFIDSQFEGKGIMSAAVASATERLQTGYDVMAEVDHDNERSKKLLRGLGTYAYFGSNERNPQKEQFFASRKRNK